MGYIVNIKMSNITQTKLSRQRSAQVYSLDKHGRLRFDLDGKPMTKKKVLGYEPPVNHRPVQLEYKGYKMYVRMSPGQMVNLRKEYIRQCKEFGINPLKLRIK